MATAEANEEVAPRSLEVLESAESDEAESPRPPSRVSRQLIVLLCAVCAVEGADQALLPSSSKALEEDLGLDLGAIGTLNMSQTMLQACAAPVWAVLADRDILTRRTILAIGCLGWGIVTVLMALSDSYLPMLMLRILNGAMLACLRPICNGLVGDVTDESRRGKVFGQLQLSVQVGQMTATFIATSISRSRMFGFVGWQMAFFVVGGLSIIIGGTVAVCVQEPKRERSQSKEEEEMEVTEKHRSCSAGILVAQEARRLLGFFMMPTFTLIIAQGLFGQVSLNTGFYFTLYLQTAGLTDFRAAVLSTACQAFGGIGNLLGGMVGDRASRRCPYHGRPFIAQISVGIGIVTTILTYGVIPRDQSSFAWFLLVLMAQGLFSSWCGCGVNLPIFSEIVPPKGRSTIIAWDSALEGAFGAIFGNMSVKFLAQHVFGYDLKKTQVEGSKEDTNAAALGRTLMLTGGTAWIFCLAFYSLMHWSYPRDLKRIQQQKETGRFDSSDETATDCGDDSEETGDSSD